MAQAIGFAVGELAGNFLRNKLFGSDSNSALASYILSKKLQEHQYELNRKTRQTAYQDTRYSLEQADYNPLLAVGQQAQGGTFGASMNVTDPKTENLQNTLATMNARSAISLNSAQAYNQIMQGKLTTAQAQNLTTQSSLNSANTALTNLQQDAQRITNKYLPKQLEVGIKKNAAEAEAALVNAESNKVSALANQMNAETNRGMKTIKAGPVSFTGYAGNGPQYGTGNTFRERNQVRHKTTAGYNNYSYRNYR